MFNPLSLHKVLKWNLCICKNEATIDYHHSYALELRNTCCRNLTQQLVS